MLIEDDEATNFLHKHIIEALDCAGKLTIAVNGRFALDEINSFESTNSPFPDLIFLDINMPMMNGWEFITEFQEMNQREDLIIVMLTSSVNPDDQKRAEHHDLINKYMRKPLKKEALERVLIEFFQP